MKAPHPQQLVLLELQKLDQKESSLRHRRQAHPAHETVRELAARLADLRRAAVSQSAVISDCERESARIEEEIERVRQRRDRQSERIEKNQVPLRDINSMQPEIAQMDERIKRLEEDQLSAEERTDAARNAQTQMNAEAEAIEADIESTKARFLEEIAELDDELRSVIAQRRERAAQIDAALLEEYEAARDKNGALAVIEVRDGNAMGFAELSPMELERIRLTPSDELYFAEDTGQIVVRTRS